MMPYEPTLDIVRRTITNLEFVERHSTPSGPYEVTQLINSFMGILCHPWEQMRDDLRGVALDDSWPDFVPASGKPCASDLHELLRKSRNAMAHGNIAFLGQSNINSLRMWNVPPGAKSADWDVTITIEELRKFLFRFTEYVEALPQVYFKKRSAQ